MSFDPQNPLQNVTPKWVIVGIRWDGPGVAIFASDSLTEAELNYRADYMYKYDNIYQLKERFARDVQRTLTVHFHDFKIVYGPTWIDCLRALLDDGWTPDTQLAIESQKSLPVD